METKSVDKEFFIGIDNGTTGSIAILDNKKNLIFHEQIPTIKTINYTKKAKTISRIDFKKLMDILSNYKNSIALLEYPAINNRFFNTSILAARAFEATIIALEQNNIIYNIIPSSKWQKYFFSKPLKKDSKFFADEKAKQIYGLKEIKKGFGDSILIATYLYETTLR